MRGAWLLRGRHLASLAWQLDVFLVPAAHTRIHVEHRRVVVAQRSSGRSPKGLILELPRERHSYSCSWVVISGATLTNSGPKGRDQAQAYARTRAPLPASSRTACAGTRIQAHHPQDRDRDRSAAPDLSPLWMDKWEAQAIRIRRQSRLVAHSRIGVSHRRDDGGCIDEHRKAKLQPQDKAQGHGQGLR